VFLESTSVAALIIVLDGSGGSISSWRWGQYYFGGDRPAVLYNAKFNWRLRYQKFFPAPQNTFAMTVKEHGTTVSLLCLANLVTARRLK
jgi:uncharacterized membrane protein SpoIIM required for sporulation